MIRKVNSSSSTLFDLPQRQALNEFIEYILSFSNEKKYFSGKMGTWVPTTEAILGHTKNFCYGNFLESEDIFLALKDLEKLSKTLFQRVPNYLRNQNQATQLKQNKDGQNVYESCYWLCLLKWMVSTQGIISKIRIQVDLKQTFSVSADSGVFWRSWKC